MNAIWQVLLALLAAVGLLALGLADLRPPADPGGGRRGRSGVRGWCPRLGTGPTWNRT